MTDDTERTPLLQGDEPVEQVIPPRMSGDHHDGHDSPVGHPFPSRRVKTCLVIVLTASISAFLVFSTSLIIIDKGYDFSWQLRDSIGWLNVILFVGGLVTVINLCTLHPGPDNPVFSPLNIVFDFFFFASVISGSSVVLGNTFDALIYGHVLPCDGKDAGSHCVESLTALRVLMGIGLAMALIVGITYLVLLITRLVSGSRNGFWKEPLPWKFPVGQFSIEFSTNIQTQEQLVRNQNRTQDCDEIAPLLEVSEGSAGTDREGGSVVQQQLGGSGHRAIPAKPLRILTLISLYASGPAIFIGVTSWVYMLIVLDQGRSMLEALQSLLAMTILIFLVALFNTRTPPPQSSLPPYLVLNLLADAVVVIVLLSLFENLEFAFYYGLTFFDVGGIILMSLCQILVGVLAMTHTILFIFRCVAAYRGRYLPGAAGSRFPTGRLGFEIAIKVLRDEVPIDR